MPSRQLPRGLGPPLVLPLARAAAVVRVSSAARATAAAGAAAATFIAARAGALPLAPPSRRSPCGLTSHVPSPWDRTLVPPFDGLPLLPQPVPESTTTIANGNAPRRAVDLNRTAHVADLRACPAAFTPEPQLRRTASLLCEAEDGT